MYRSLIFDLGGVGGQFQAPVALSPAVKVPVPIVQDAGWAPPQVWTGVDNKKYFIPTGVRALHYPARSESPYRLRYPGPFHCQ
jgi:hypothetical protein